MSDEKDQKQEAQPQPQPQAPRRTPGEAKTHNQALEERIAALEERLDALEDARTAPAAGHETQAGKIKPPQGGTGAVKPKRE